MRPPADHPEPTFENLTLNTARAQIGGWLTVFCITCGLGIMSLAISTFKTTTLSYKLIGIFSLTMALVVLLLVFNRSRLAVAALWVDFAARVILSAWHGHLIWHLRYAYTKSGQMTDVITSQIFPIGVMGAWLLYFHYSRRVHETFGQNL